MEEITQSTETELPKPKMVQWFDDHFYKVVIEKKHLQYNKDLIIGEMFFPSVTTKLGVSAKPFLGRWRGDVGNFEADRRLNEGGQKGTRMHHAWLNYHTGGIVIYNNPQAPEFTYQQLADLEKQYGVQMSVIYQQQEMYELTKLVKWIDIVKPEFLESERIVFSLKNCEAGTMDNLVKIKGGKYSVNGKTPLEIPEGIYVLDLKTGTVVDDDAEMQTAAYLYQYEEMYPKRPKIAGTIILHTNAKTTSGDIPGLATKLSLRPKVDNDYLAFRAAATLWNFKNEERPKVFEFPNMLHMKLKTA